MEKKQSEYILQFCLELWQNQICQLHKQKMSSVSLQEFTHQTAKFNLVPLLSSIHPFPPVKGRIRERKKERFGPTYEL